MKIILLLLIPITLKAPPYIDLLSSNDRQERTFYTNKFNFELFKKAVEFNCSNYDIVIKQAILETGWFKSNIFKTKNNLFGFYDGKGKYNHWYKSVIDYARYQKRKYKGGDYYSFLRQSGYSVDSLYIDKLKRINYE